MSEYIHTYSLMDMSADINTYMCACIHAYRNAYINMYIHMYMERLTSNTHAQKAMFTYKHACLHTCTYA